MCALFAETLGVPQAGADDSFFDLNGQSVLAAILISRINCTLGVNLSIADLFEAPTVAGLDRRLENFHSAAGQQKRSSDGDGRLPVPPADATGQRSPRPGAETAPEQGFPMSLNQEFLCAFDKGDIVGTFGHRHILVDGWRIAGQVDVGALQGAINDVVVRHEILRTLVSRDPAGSRQLVYPPSPVKLEIRQLKETPGRSRESCVEGLLSEAESGTLSARSLPLLQAILGKFDDRDSVLVLVAHHCASDPWSMQLIMRDLAAYYAARRGLRERK